MTAVNDRIFLYTVMKHKMCVFVSQGSFRYIYISLLHGGNKKGWKNTKNKSWLAGSNTMATTSHLPLRTYLNRLSLDLSLKYHACLVSSFLVNALNCFFQLWVVQLATWEKKRIKAESNSKVFLMLTWNTTPPPPCVFRFHKICLRPSESSLQASVWAGHHQLR